MARSFSEDGTLVTNRDEVYRGAAIPRYATQSKGFNLSRWEAASCERLLPCLAFCVLLFLPMGISWSRGLLSESPS